MSSHPTSLDDYNQAHAELVGLRAQRIEDTATIVRLERAQTETLFAAECAQLSERRILEEVKTERAQLRATLAGEAPAYNDDHDAWPLPEGYSWMRTGDGAPALTRNHASGLIAWFEKTWLRMDEAIDGDAVCKLVDRWRAWQGMRHVVPRAQTAKLELDFTQWTSLADLTVESAIPLVGSWIEAKHCEGRIARPRFPVYVREIAAALVGEWSSKVSINFGADDFIERSDWLVRIVPQPEDKPSHTDCRSASAASGVLATQASGKARK